MKNIVSIVIVILLLTPFAKAHSNDVMYLNYHELITKIKSGNIRSVTIGNFRDIHGVYLEGDVEKEFSSWHIDEAANDPLLINLLKENGIEITVEERDRSYYEPRLIPYIFFVSVFLIPLIAVVLLIIILRKVNRLLSKAEGIN